MKEGSYAELVESGCIMSSVRAKWNACSSASETIEPVSDVGLFYLHGRWGGDTPLVDKRVLL